MPSNEERREVAERFRDFEMLRDVFKESNVCAFLYALNVCYMDWEHICARLADLIEPEERTCRDECGGELDFHCSECGCHLYLISIENESSLMLGEAAIQPSFCPNCGAKVVEE